MLTRALNSSGGGSLTETILWTNGSPSSDFTAGTFSLDTGKKFSDYDYIKFIWYNSKSDRSVENETIIPFSAFQRMDNGTTIVPFIALGYRASSTSRMVRMVMYESDTSIYFSATSYWNSTGSSNGNVIPYKIIGLK